VVGHILFLLPFDFLMEQLGCSESVVAISYNILFYVFFILWVYPPLTFLHLAPLCVDFNCCVETENNNKVKFVLNEEVFASQ
jgi:hypothetical protein